MHKEYALELLADITSNISKDQRALIHALLYIGDQIAEQTQQLEKNDIRGE